jgi:hypothetical protein
MLFIVLVLLSLLFLYTLEIEPVTEYAWVTADNRAHLNKLDRRLVDVLDKLFLEYANGDSSESLLSRIERRLYVFPLLTGKDEQTDVIIGDVLKEIRPFI